MLSIKKLYPFDLTFFRWKLFNFDKLKPLYEVVNSLQLIFKTNLIILFPIILKNNLIKGISHLPPFAYLEPITKEFVIGLLPQDKLVNFLGRGQKYPECGWVCYNRRHPKIKKFMETWTDLYNKDTIFNEMEWHDSYLFWQIVQRVAPQDGVDIGKGAGAKGHHVFINSVLGEYIDHMKGKRKIKGKSSRSDLRTQRNEKYWQNVENYNPFGGIKFDPKQAQDIISKVAKGKTGN